MASPKRMFAMRAPPTVYHGRSKSRTEGSRRKAKDAKTELGACQLRTIDALGGQIATRAGAWRGRGVWHRLSKQYIVRPATPGKTRASA
eukprot:scaffold141633_cov31-Tisochrysis_lutea.AAC.4